MVGRKGVPVRPSPFLIDRLASRLHGSRSGAARGGHVDACAACGFTEAKDMWAQWRGPLGTGVAPDAQPPVEWSETKNIRWKSVLPGKGHSSPVVWGEQIFLTTAIPFGEPLKPRFVRPGAHDNLGM